MSDYAASSIAVRAVFRCARCREIGTTNQVATVAREAETGALVWIDPPRGWTVERRQAYCPAHAPRERRAA